MATAGDVDFAYKYPFSDEAKLIVKELSPKSIDLAQLDAAKERINDAIKNGKMGYTGVDYEKIKTDYILGYVYSRMLISAMKSPLAIKAYSAAEATRSAAVMEGDSDKNVLRLCTELGINAKMDGGLFYLKFSEFLRFAPKDHGFELVNQSLKGGSVALDKHALVKVAEVAMVGAIEGGLPINPKTLPKPILDAANNIQRPIRKSVVQYASNGSGWIDKLIHTPIPDCRHRTVNLILAPYFINVKGMGVEDATKMIWDYINLCKTVNPNTNITERYIHYQCHYAKTHGMHPLSLKRAKDELFGSMDLDIFSGFNEEDEKDAKRVK